LILISQCALVNTPTLYIGLITLSYLPIDIDIDRYSDCQTLFQTGNSGIYDLISLNPSITTVTHLSDVRS